MTGTFSSLVLRTWDQGHGLSQHCIGYVQKSTHVFNNWAHSLHKYNFDVFHIFLIRLHPPFCGIPIQLEWLVLVPQPTPEGLSDRTPSKNPEIWNARVGLFLWETGKRPRHEIQTDRCLKLDNHHTQEVKFFSDVSLDFQKARSSSSG